jgi:Ankyrin repeat
MIRLLSYSVWVRILMWSITYIDDFDEEPCSASALVESMYYAISHTAIRVWHRIAHKTAHIMSTTLSIYLYQAGSTPLTDAANKGHASVVTVLLDRGADINKRDEVRHSYFSNLYAVFWTNIVIMSVRYCHIWLHFVLHFTRWLPVTFCHITSRFIAPLHFVSFQVASFECLLLL